MERVHIITACAWLGLVMAIVQVRLRHWEGQFFPILLVAIAVKVVWVHALAKERDIERGSAILARAVAQTIPSGASLESSIPVDSIFAYTLWAGTKPIHANGPAGHFALRKVSNSHPTISSPPSAIVTANPSTGSPGETRSRRSLARHAPSLTPTLSFFDSSHQTSSATGGNQTRRAIITIQRRAIMTLRGTVLSLCVLTATAWSDPIPKTPAGRLIEQDKVLVIAHRGDSKAAPEKHPPRIRVRRPRRLRSGRTRLRSHRRRHANRHSRRHARPHTDADDKWGAKKIRVDTKKLAELADLDAGKWFDPKFEGTRLPTLEASIDLIQKGSVTLIERKAGDAKTCVDLLERKEIVQDVVVQAFDWKFLADCRSLRKDLVLGALGTGKLSRKRSKKSN